MNPIENIIAMSFSTWSQRYPDKLGPIKSHPAISIIIAGLSCFYAITLLTSYLFGVKVPYVGYRSLFEPTWFVRLRFVWAGGSIISEGYQKFKTSLFQVRKIGTDIIIIPPNYVDEVRKLSQDNTRSVEPFIHDFAGEYTRGLVFLQSDLQNRVIQQRLTPRLASLTAVMKEEFDLALAAEMPKVKGMIASSDKSGGPTDQHQDDTWAKVDMSSIFIRLISRISARVFLGPDDCHNEEWLNTTAEYSQNLFITGFALRIFPHFLRPFIAPLLPSYRALLRNVSSARRIIGSMVHFREAQQEFQADANQDILQWMMSAATGEEKKPENLAQRMLILSLASIHTTATTMSHAMYDLCDRPEYFEPLREEITGVLGDGGWQKTTLNRLHKLDSLLKESQRFSPVFLLTFNRIFHQPLRLSDGTYLPAGTRVAVPSHAMLQDAAHVPGSAPPTEFDAFRYSKVREGSESAQKYLFSMTDPSNMAFGYGKYACPGRFYASNEMKLVLANLLLLYDFKLPEGTGRPRNITIDSDMVPDPRARLYVRKRAPSRE
ncbi:Ent-kaurene oxidase [Fusarium sp. Ph1]|nr:Ent-kaurene oxidase [Fusarium sp. Ph1]